MAISATVTPGHVFTTSSKLDVTNLNAAANPTVDIEGAIGSLSLATDSVSNSHVASGAAIAHSKLADLTDGNLLVGSGSDVPTSVAMSGDATIDNTGAVTIGAGAVTFTKIAGAAVVTDYASGAEGISSNNDNITLPTTAAVKEYVDASTTAEDTLEEMNDTVITSAANNDFLVHNGSEWVNESALIAKGSLGIGSVDNTTDADKPVSTAQQAEIDTKQDTVTAGTGLSFSGATLNAEVTQSEVDAKQDTITAGTGLSFSGATLNAEVTQSSPALTGTPTAPTAGSGTDTTQIATTAFVQQEFTKANINGHAYPVGSVYTSIVSTNPATLLGVGTWAAFGAGRVLVGLDSGDTDFDTAEETGGSKTHTLTESEMPSHTHTTEIVRSSLSGSTASFGPFNSAASPSNSYTSSATGSGSAHNNVQPYIVVYFWKRTA